MVKKTKNTSETDNIQLELDTDTSYSFKLESFEGPLDLLLHLIKEAKIDICNIFISEITEQYLLYMTDIDNLDMDKASEFILVASILIEMKSKSLLPKEVVDEEDTKEDDGAELIRRLEEYKLFKETSEKLKVKENVNMLYREPDNSCNNFRTVLKDMTMDGLIHALSKLFVKIDKRDKTPQQRNIVLDRFTVADKIMEISDVIKYRQKASFYELFDEDYTKSEIITTFQALLELMKMQVVSVAQQEVFGDITVFLKTA